MIAVGEGATGTVAGGDASFQMKGVDKYGNKYSTGWVSFSAIMTAVDSGLVIATTVSQGSCSRVPVASLASRPARASPATFRVGELGALRRRASVLLKCHRETGRDRGVRVADPTFTSRES